MRQQVLSHWTVQNSYSSDFTSHLHIIGGRRFLSRRCLPINRKQTPFAGDAFETKDAAVIEFKT